jgi:hypothetical protein
LEQNFSFTTGLVHVSFIDAPVHGLGDPVTVRVLEWVGYRPGDVGLEALILTVVVDNALLPAILFVLFLPLLPLLLLLLLTVSLALALFLLYWDFGLGFGLGLGLGFGLGMGKVILGRPGITILTGGFVSIVRSGSGGSGFLRLGSLGR